jgi:hypothetical protein
VTTEPKKYAAVPGAKKDVLTVAKITRLAAGQTIREFLSRLWGGLMPVQSTINIALALI